MDGGCRMMCFRVMRQMKEDVWCTGNKPILTSLHLQVGTAVKISDAGKGKKDGGS